MSRPRSITAGIAAAGLVFGGILFAAGARSQAAVLIAGALLAAGSSALFGGRRLGTGGIDRQTIAIFGAMGVVACAAAVRAFVGVINGQGERTLAAGLFLLGGVLCLRIAWQAWQRRERSAPEARRQT